MSGSLLNKNTAVLNAIAITTALAILSGYLPVQPISLTQLQIALQSHLPHNQK